MGQMNWNGIGLPDKNIYFQDEDVVIYCADNRDILPLIPDKSIDLVLTDPPYGIGWQSNWRQDTFDKMVGDDFVSGKWIGLCHSNIFYLFTRWDVLQKWIDIFNPYNITVRDVLVWDKLAHGAGDLSSYAPTYELIIYATKERVKLLGNRPQNILRHWRVDAGAMGMSSGKLLRHPAQKPDELFTDILSHHTSQLILDPFLGSGTTAYCAKKLGRKCIGIELSEKYCQIAVDRLRQAVMKLEK